MTFLTSDIDHAIVITQHDLRGFLYFGVRTRHKSAQVLDAITGNFVAFASGSKNCISYFKSSFKDYLSVCEKIYDDCNEPQREAIQLIIQDIILQNEELRKEASLGKRDASDCLVLKEDNRWGKAVLALAEVFEIDLKEVVHS
ncbi:MAG: hypothetical protein PHH17_01305 [Candidatus Pacebacteria bacterium]|nr:hypothetical protein [Candidatus Paceibacterota bacterium]MDD3728962.1 hypothetical protein [Candidatus Paceibacterota bacterium]MDD5445831.1 hypothetical protein [Candidatus Paceibacterota bacterium]